MVFFFNMLQSNSWLSFQFKVCLQKVLVCWLVTKSRELSDTLSNLMVEVQLAPVESLLMILLIVAN